MKPGTAKAMVRAGGTWNRDAWTKLLPTWRSPKKYAETTPQVRQRRLRAPIASLQLSLARRRGHLAGAIEQARFLASPVTRPSDEDIALDSELRAVALMNLGTAEAWSLGLPDAERDLREGAVLAREIGRPYLEIGCGGRVVPGQLLHTPRVEGHFLGGPPAGARR